MQKALQKSKNVPAIFKSLAKGAKTASTGAVIGATAGAGYGEGSVKDQAKNIGVGALAGGVGGAALAGLGRAATTGMKRLGIGKEGSRLIQRRTREGKDLKPDLKQASKQIKEVLKTSEKTGNNYAKIADSKLTNKKVNSLTPDAIKLKISRIKDDFGIGKDVEATNKAAQDLISQIERAGAGTAAKDGFTEIQIRNFIKSLSNAYKSGNVQGTAGAEFSAEMRRFLSNVLKDHNKEYGKWISKSADIKRPLLRVKDKLIGKNKSSKDLDSSKLPTKTSKVGEADPQLSDDLAILKLRTQKGIIDKKRFDYSTGVKRLNSAFKNKKRMHHISKKMLKDLYSTFETNMNNAIAEVQDIKIYNKIDAEKMAEGLIEKVYRNIGGVIGKNASATAGWTNRLYDKLPEKAQEFLPKNYIRKLFNIQIAKANSDKKETMERNKKRRKDISRGY